MDKEHMEEKQRKQAADQEFKNEFVENSNKNETTKQQQPASKLMESYEADREPNGMDPEAIFEKGLSFQETPEEYYAQRANRFGKEPNGMNPDDR